MRKSFFTLRSRLMLIIILTSIPGILLLWLTGLEQRQQAIQDAQDEVIHLGRVATKMQSELIYNARSFLVTIAHLPTIRTGDMIGCQEILTDLIGEHFNYYSSFYVADLKGNIVCSPPGMHTPPDFNECNHYKTLIQSTDFVFSGYHICRNTGKAVFSIGYPIYDMQDQLTLVTNVSLDLIWFYEFAGDVALPTGSELLVLDEKGIILSHFPDNDQWRGTPLSDQTALRTLFESGEGAITGSNLTGDQTLYAISTIEGTNQKIYVAMGIPTEVAFAEANQTLRRNMIILLAVMAGVLATMWLLGDVLIAKQARTLVQTTNLLAQGDLTARTGINYNQGELGQLARSFDEMASDLANREAEREKNMLTLSEYARNLEHSNEELRNFSNIASHDLQEPLRKIQTFGEMLQDRYKTTLDARGVDLIQRMQDASSRMQVLLNEMLNYSRATIRAKSYKIVDLNQVVKQVLKDLDFKIEQKKAKIEVSSLPTIEADPFQINQLMQNLVSNALKFHQPDKAPVIHIYSPYPKCDTDPRGMCEIRVQDEGIGFEEKYLERIFQPFQRLNGRLDYDGAGMGLTICRKIVDHHGGSINAHSIPGKGTTFIVLLPKKQTDERQAAS